MSLSEVEVSTVVGVNSGPTATEEALNNENINLDNENNNNEISETRKRSVTQKGKQYQCSLFLQRRKSHHNRLLRQLTLVATCMESASVEMTNQEVSNLDRIFSEVVEANLKYGELLEDEAEKEECQKYFDIVDDLVFQQKTKVCTWLKEQDVSERGSRGSIRSSRSRRSSPSKASSRHSSKRSVRLKAGSKKTVRLCLINRYVPRLAPQNR